MEFLLVEWLASVFQPMYQKRVALHEAGHFLIAYLSGLLPKSYTLSALDDFRKSTSPRMWFLISRRVPFLRYRRFNIQAGTTFCDSEFQAEIKSGTQDTALYLLFGQMFSC